jgi:hypothetical protein
MPLGGMVMVVMPCPVVGRGTIFVLLTARVFVMSGLPPKRTLQGANSRHTSAACPGGGQFIP